MARVIGIVHRIKKTAKNEARPTLIFIKNEATGKMEDYKLETETDELDFLTGRWPKKYRKAAVADDLTKFHSWQIKQRPLKKGENPNSFPANLIQKKGKQFELAEKVPVKLEGLKTGDTVAMVLGGSGDRFAYALSKRGAEIGAKVVRIKPKDFSDRRGNEPRDNDSKLLVELAISNPELFQKITPRDAQLIKLREKFFERRDAMKDRITCKQRLRQRLRGQIFLSDEGYYPEGSIEDMHDAQTANDIIFQNLEKEEKKRNAELAALVESFDVYQKIFKSIKGCGPMIAAGIIAAVGDVRKFPTAAKFKAFCGVHLVAKVKEPDGKINRRKLRPGEVPLSDPEFARKRHGEVADWPEEARQALFLLFDQFNRRPDSKGGRLLRHYKEIFRQKHPEVIINNEGKKKYTDGHIHRMACWRTLTKFAEWLYREWKKLYEAEDNIPLTPPKIDFRETE